MWGAITGWLPGLTKALEAAQPGIVPTPADIQAESDAPDPADVPAQAEAPTAPEPQPEQPPERPAVSSRLPPVNTPAPIAHMDLKPSITETLRATCQTLRRERDDARAEALRTARQLAAEKRVSARLREQLDAALEHLPPTALSTLGWIVVDTATPSNPQHDGSTTSGGVGGPSGSAAGAVDGPAGPVRLGEADRTGGAARDH